MFETLLTLSLNLLLVQILKCCVLEMFSFSRNNVYNHLLFKRGNVCIIVVNKPLLHHDIMWKTQSPDLGIRELTYCQTMHVNNNHQNMSTKINFTNHKIMGKSNLNQPILVRVHNFLIITLGLFTTRILKMYNSWPLLVTICYKYITVGTLMVIELNQLVAISGWKLWLYLQSQSQSVYRHF